LHNSIHMGRKCDFQLGWYDLSHVETLFQYFDRHYQNAVLICVDQVITCLAPPTYNLMAMKMGWPCIEGNELCVKCVCFICILLYCNRLSFLTIATFPATYTLQQLGRSLQKNEKLVTVCLARSNFAPIHLPRRNTPAYGTHHLCVAILTTEHILTCVFRQKIFSVQNPKRKFILMDMIDQT
jgi:hypothetical protein